MKRMLIDTICVNPTCRRKRFDVWIEQGQYPSCELCEHSTERLWEMGASAHAHGDECDITIKHGLCHPDGTPRRFTSKEEIRRAEKSSGWVNHVVHMGSKGSDKSKHTSRWV